MILYDCCFPYVFQVRLVALKTFYALSSVQYKMTGNSTWLLCSPLNRSSSSCCFCNIFSLSFVLSALICCSVCLCGCTFIISSYIAMWRFRSSDEGFWVCSTDEVLVVLDIESVGDGEGEGLWTGSLDWTPKCLANMEDLAFNSFAFFAAAFLRFCKKQRAEFSFTLTKQVIRYSRLSLSWLRLSRITAYLEVKFWSLF